MFQSQPEFSKRLAKLDRKHMAMTHGYKTVMRGDGLIIVKPTRKAHWGFPLKLLLGLVFGLFVFKGLMIASLTEITYNERVAKLNQGSAIERGGAWVMQVEPVSKFLAGFIDPYVK